MKTKKRISIYSRQICRGIMHGIDEGPLDKLCEASGLLPINAEPDHSNVMLTSQVIGTIASEDYSVTNLSYH